MTSLTKKYELLVRREIWENGTMIWRTPLVIAGVALLALLVSLLLGRLDLGEHVSDVVEWANAQKQLPADERSYTLDFSTGTVKIDAENADMVMWGADVSNAVNGVLHVVAIAFQVIATIVAIFYALYCLYTDRDDKSILFWKSLPVRESETIAAKLVVALFVIPLVALLVSVIVQIVYGTVTAYLFSKNEAYGFWGAMAEMNIVGVFVTHALLILLSSAKVLPLFSYFLLISAVAKKSPILIALLPPIVLLVVERLIFRTDMVTTFLGGIFNPGEYSFDGMDQFGFLALEIFQFAGTWTDLMMGLVISGLFLAATVWARNNRYEI